MKPLNVVQPEGPSFEVHGNEISWQKWKMRMSFNNREGLVLHNIGCAAVCTACFCRLTHLHLLHLSICSGVHIHALPFRMFLGLNWFAGRNEQVRTPFRSVMGVYAGGMIRYEDGGRVRPIIHRASTVEIIVPYGDPRAPFHKKCAFDVVDYGLGFSCSSLELGCDCLGHIKYFDAVLNTNKGEPSFI